jgi:chemotaxis signal transduction protein
MAITVIAGTASASNGGTPAPTIPGTPQAGDWMIAFYASREATDGTVSLPAGWDQRVNDRGAGGLVAAWTRPWQSGDAAPAFTVGGHATGSSGDSNQAVIHLVRPTAGQTLEFVDASTPSHNGASSTTVGPIDGDSLTVAANGIVFVLGQHRETWTSVATLSGDGLTWAQETDNSNASGADNALAIDWALSNNVAVTDKSYTITGSGGSATGSGFMLFLKEVSGITASLSSTEDEDSLQASAALTVTAVASLTEGGDSLSATSSVVAATEILRISWAQLEIPEAPEVTSTASLSATELDDTLVGAIALSISSALSALEDQDTLAAGMSVGAQAEILRISWAQLEIPEGAGIAASLSVTESGDTLESSASVAGAGVTGSLAVIESEDTLAASASVAAAQEILRISWAQLELPEASESGITASLSTTEGNDSLSSSATVQGNSSLSVDAFSISISFESAARAFAVTAAPFTITASFADEDLEWSGGSRLVASILEDVDVVAASAAIAISASTAVVEDSDYLSSSASVAGGAITATAALDEEWDVVAASAAIALGAAAAVVEDPDTLVAETNATGSVNVSLSVQELDDVVSASATLALSAQAALAEDGDVLAASSSVTIVASASVLEDADSLTGQLGTPQIAADVAVTESDDTVTASASLSVAASVSITEADDLSSASASVFIVADASITEEDDDFTGGWGRQSFPAHIGLSNKGRGPRATSRSKGSITTTEWP